MPWRRIWMKPRSVRTNGPGLFGTKQISKSSLVLMPLGSLRTYFGEVLECLIQSTGESKEISQESTCCEVCRSRANCGFLNGDGISKPPFGQGIVWGHGDSIRQIQERVARAIAAYSASSLRASSM